MGEPEIKKRKVISYMKATLSRGQFALPRVRATAGRENAQCLQIFSSFRLMTFKTVNKRILPGNIIVNSLRSAGIHHGHVVVDQQLRHDALLCLGRTFWQARIHRTLKILLVE